MGTVTISQQLAATKTGLTLTVNIYAGTSLATTANADERPTGSARYVFMVNGLAANTVFEWALTDGTKIYATDKFKTDANGNDAALSKPAVTLNSSDVTGNLPAAGNWAQPGDPMAVNPAGVLAIQAGFVDETDGQQVLAAIVNKFNATDVDLAGLTVGAIANATATAVRTNLNTTKLDVKLNATDVTGYLPAQMNAAQYTPIANAVGGVIERTGGMLDGKLTTAAFNTAFATLHNFDPAVSPVYLSNTGLTAVRDGLATQATSAQILAAVQAEAAQPTGGVETDETEVVIL